MRKGGRRESGRTSEREGEGNCLNRISMGSLSPSLFSQSITRYPLA